LGPVLCGAVLAVQPPQYIFYMLMLFIIAGGMLYFLGAAIAGNTAPGEEGVAGG